MASRPVFLCADEKPYYKDISTEFEFASGFSLSQKQKCIENLHSAFLKQYPNSRILEISSKSKQELGICISAFNLKINKDNNNFSVESAFQSSKVFTNGGPFIDLLTKEPREAKKDERIKNSGELISFSYFSEEFSLQPKTYFYDWIYINALNNNKEYVDNLKSFNAFTDIEFNPTRSINCQARSACIFASLLRNNLLDKALQSKESFREMVYSGDESYNTKFAEKKKTAKSKNLTIDLQVFNDKIMDFMLQLRSKNNFDDKLFDEIYDQLVVLIHQWKKQEYLPKLGFLGCIHLVDFLAGGSRFYSDEVSIKVENAILSINDLFDQLEA